MSVVTNIAGRQIATRRVAGILFLIIGIILSVLAIVNSWPNSFGIWLFLIYLTGFLSYLEAYYEVCAVNALRNMQSMEGTFSFGQEKVGDEVVAKRVRKIAGKQTIQSIILSGVATAIIFIF